MTASAACQGAALPASLSLHLLIWFILPQALHAAGAAQLGSWESHPLIRALLAQPAAQGPLLQGLQRRLHSLPQSPAKQQQQLVQYLVQPFISFVLLWSDTSGECMLLVYICPACACCDQCNPSHAVRVRCW